MKKKRLLTTITLIIPVLFFSVMHILSVSGWTILYYEPANNATRFNSNPSWPEGEIIYPTNISYGWLTPLLVEPDFYTGQLLVASMHPTSQFYNYTINNSPAYWTGGVPWSNVLAVQDMCGANNTLLETFINEDYYPNNSFGTPYAVAFIEVTTADLNNSNLRCISYRTGYNTSGSIVALDKAAFFSGLATGLNIVSPGSPGNFIEINMLVEGTVTRQFEMIATPIFNRSVSNLVLFEVPSNNLIQSANCTGTAGLSCNMTLFINKSKVHHLISDDSTGLVTIDAFIS